MRHDQRESKYAVDLPYPEIGEVGKNEKYALYLHDDYAGSESELSAITQYAYQHFLLDETYKEVAETTMGIAQVEMKHLGLLGETIVKLSGNPLFTGGFNSNGRFWNGDFPYYNEDVKGLLTANIYIEKTAIVNYRKHIVLIREPGIQALLNRIIMDEELHVRLYTDLLIKYQ